MRESIFSVELQKILHKVGQQSYTPVTSKEPEDSRKLSSTWNNIWDTEESVQEACFENFNQQVIKRNTTTGKKMEKTSHWYVSCSPGPERKDPPLKGSAVPSSDSREYSSHHFQHLLPSLQGLRWLFLGDPVSTWPSANRICMWLSKCHVIFKIH